MAKTDNQQWTAGQAAGQQSDATRAGGGEERARREANQPAGDQSFSQKGSGYANNGGQQPQGAAAPMRGLGTLLLVGIGSLIGWSIQGLISAIRGPIWKGAKAGFSFVRPYAEDMFFNWVGQKGTVVEVRDRKSNEVIDRIVFDRNGRSVDGLKLDPQQLMERYKINGYGRDVEINLYAVPDITYYRGFKFKPLEESQLAQRFILREEMWKTKSKGTSSMGLDAAYKAFNRNQDIRYYQSLLKQYMDQGDFGKAFELLRQTMKQDTTNGVSIFNHLMLAIDEDRGNWLSRMKGHEIGTLQKILRESTDRLYLNGVEDYVDVDMATLSVTERVLARTFIADRACVICEYEELYPQVRASLSRFDLEQEWQAKRDKFWEQDEAEIWSLCVWAKDCEATRILNEQAEILLKGVADASDISHLLPNFEKGDSPVAQYLASVYEFQQACSSHYREKRDQMWELYGHPDVQKLELAKLNELLSKKRNPDELMLEPDRLREVATVMANLYMGGIKETNDELDRLRKTNPILKKMLNSDEFQREFRRAVNIKGIPLDDIDGTQEQTDDPDRKVVVLEAEEVTPDYQGVRTEHNPEEFVSSSEMHVPTEFTPSVDTIPLEDYDEMAQQAKVELGVSAPMSRSESELVEMAAPSDRVRLSSFYPRFDASVPDRPELLTELGIHRLPIDDEQALKGAVAHVWSEAMALCLNLATPQQIRKEGVSGSLIKSEDRLHEIGSTLDKLLTLYQPILEDLRVACEMESVEQLVDKVLKDQQTREIEEVHNMNQEMAPNMAVQEAQAVADSLMKTNPSSVPPDFYAVMFDFTFPSNDGMQEPSVQYMMQRANRIVALSDAVKEGRVEEEHLLALFHDEPMGIVGVPSNATAQQIVAGIEALKASYETKKAEFLNDRLKQPEHRASHASKGFKR